MNFTMQLREIRKVKPLFSTKLPAKTQDPCQGDDNGRPAAAQDHKAKQDKRHKEKSQGPTGKKHTVREGQTWEALAYTYKVPLKTLRSWNTQIPKGTRLKPGMVVIVG
ncbi:LysM peptidoglycan-binding domain-containing protein [Paenibacillus melissococcoides]|uniref:LysM peptidoglycan-binding domain-containing protein n=1 Tax=Paenibacillus melissococcoides TaxID=2912268 RepID=UPI0021C452C9|nr:LysM domain-containing protein [Paenibacillus melissococcoides]CAH8708622.1 LysM peptidoglycan-binding domain-containing protein [Paenibacillus melissococcoides]CAH8718614.1 LysM peptidoglycan-binding domain-containing protein [Paenibacillus melissococcoides]